MRKKFPFVGVIAATCWITAAAPPLQANDDFGVRLSSAGTVNASAFPPGFGCTGEHTANVRFTPMPSPGNNFQVFPWVTPQPQVTIPANDTPAVPVSLALGTLPPGKHQGFLTLECTSCSTNTCGGTATGAWVSVTIPHATTFGASPTDASFAGLVSGQPVSIHTLLPNVLADIKNSSFAQVPGATQIFNELESEYFDVDIIGPELSDVTFVKTVDNVRSGGRVSSRVVSVDGESTAPGDAVYVLNRGSGIAADAFASEEIYIGVDMSTQGIHMARQNPSDYYVFTLDGQIGVINKSDLVHNIVHEGLHAVHGGKYNVATPSGGGRASCIEEEIEAFRVGDAAQSALGLTPSGTVPNARGYNRGSNPGYVPLLPTLVPAAGGGTTAPGTGGTAPSGGGTAPSGSSSTDQSSAAPGTDGSTGFRFPDFDGFPAEGYCTSDGTGFDCVGSPNFALSCAPGIESGSCTLSGTQLSDPCTYGADGWSCTMMPAGVVNCTDGLCAPDYTVPIGDVCTASGSGYGCSRLPAFELVCNGDGSCSLGDEGPSTAAGTALDYDFWYGHEPAPTTPTTHTVQPGENLFRIALRYGTTVAELSQANNLTSPTVFAGQQLTIPTSTTFAAPGDLPFDIGTLNTNTLLAGSRETRVQLEIVFVSRTRVGDHGATGTVRTAGRAGWLPPHVAELFTPFRERFAPRARVRTIAAGIASEPEPARTRTSVTGTLPGVSTLSSSQAQSATPIRALFTSLGVSTGDAFAVELVNDGAPIDIGATGLVLEPLDAETQRAARAEFARASSGKTTRKLTATGYCLELAKEPPPAGMVFRVAPRALQEQFTPMRDIWRSAKRLLDAGGLSPDSDPTQYFHSIVQWSMWSQENGFELQSFGEAFVARTRKNFEAANQPWTDQVEQAVRQIIPNRWNDIERILEESKRLRAAVRN